jgi:hypothetical protein
MTDSSMTAAQWKREQRAKLRERLGKDHRFSKALDSLERDGSGTEPTTLISARGKPVSQLPHQYPWVDD